MSLVDFGTVQVYQMNDMVEVVSPHDKVLGGFLGRLKGSWCRPRRCWQINPRDAQMSSDELTRLIKEHLEGRAPKKWDRVMEILKGHGCVTTKFEVFAGISGVRFTLPLGHPCHHHLKEVQGLTNDKKKWLIPAPYFSDKIVQKSLARIYNEDQKKFREFLYPVQERALIGEVCIPRGGEERYGLQKGKLVAASASFIIKADPAMAKSEIREFAFEVVKCERRSDERLKVTLEYSTEEAGYNFLKERVYADNPSRAIDHTILSDDQWVQKRL